jgi:hypothetical protein
MAARQRRDWLDYFPLLPLCTVCTGLGTLWIYETWSVAIDIGHQGSSPQEIFYGNLFRDPDVAQFTVPIDLVAAVFLSSSP